MYSVLNFENLTGESFLNYLLDNYVCLKFDVPTGHSLNYPKISALCLVGPIFIMHVTLSLLIFGGFVLFGLTVWRLSSI